MQRSLLESEVARLMILDYSKRFGVVLLFLIVLLMVMNGLMVAMSANDGQQANATIMGLDVFTSFDHFWSDLR